MKTFKIFCLLPGSLLIGWLIAGCETTSSTTTPQTDCRIQQHESVTQSKYYNQTEKTTYEYNGRGDLLKITDTYDKRPADGASGAQTGNKTTTHTYDGNGFLTASVTQELYVTTASRSIREQITTSSGYTYTNGRLSGYTIKRVGAYGLTTNTIGSLTYDAAGDLTGRTETVTTIVHDPSIAKELPIGAGESVRTWTYQKSRLVDYVQKSGNSESRPLKIQNGVITSLTGANYEIRYEYDSRQRLTKQEFFTEGRLNDYFVQTWTEAKSAVASLPLPKGFPAAAQILDYGSPGVPASVKTFFRNPISNEVQPIHERTSVVQTNDQGYATKMTTVLNYATASDQDYTTTETFTFTGC